MLKPTIFREYDIRGVADSELLSPDVEQLGRGLGTYLRRHGGGDNINVGRDCRLSSTRLRDALVKGLLAERFHRLAIQIAAGIEIHVATQQVEPASVGHDLDRRDKGMVGDGPVARAEDDQIAPRRDLAGDRRFVERDPAGCDFGRHRRRLRHQRRRHGVVSGAIGDYVQFSLFSYLVCRDAHKQSTLCAPEEGWHHLDGI